MDAKHTLGEPRCLISRSALLHNTQLIRKAVGPSVKICAVVKADAYGHGAEIVVDTLCNFTSSDAEPPVVDGLAVADLDEAAALPDSGLPIFTLRPVENAYMGSQRSRLEAAIHHGWVLTVCSKAAAEDLARIAQSRGQRANVQIMMNTGMNRAGVDPDDFDALFKRVVALPGLRLLGLATHFACAEEPGHAFNAEQFQRFIQTTDGVVAGARVHRTAANSGAIFFLPQSHLDMVRPGISLYGIDPTCRPSLDRTLRPVMRWTAPLVNVREIAAGATVGYGQTWVAARPTRLGLVPVGYADGYPRCISNQACMMIEGVAAPVVGRVSMDLTVIDLTDIPTAQTGDEVIVLDNDPLSPASVYRLAEMTHTIPYEILCRIGPRVRRVAVDDFIPRIATAQSGARAVQ